MAWTETTLQSLLAFSNGRSSPERTEAGQIPVYGSNGIIGFSNESNSPARTIIVGRVGSYCGSLYLAPKDCWVTDNAIRATAKGDNDPIFLYFLLTTLNLNDKRAGSGQPLLNQSILNSVPVRVPDPKDQKAIAKILSSLDDKIELNRRMSATLEAMARALFKAWFVDFEPAHANLENRPSTSASPEIAKLFPSDFENGIPKGWEMVKLVDVCERITKGTTPKKFAEQGINFIKAESLTTDRGFIPEKFAVIDNETNTSLLRSQLREDDVLFSIAGTIGRIARVIPDILPANTNQALAIVRANKDRIDPLFVELLLSREEILHSLTGKTVQAVQANLSLTVLGATEFALPSEGVLHKAFSVINSLDVKIKENSRQNEVLKKIRDSLLPRLISGKLRAEGRSESVFLAS